MVADPTDVILSEGEGSPVSRAEILRQAQDDMDQGTSSRIILVSKRTWRPDTEVRPYEIAGTGKRARIVSVVFRCAEHGTKKGHRTFSVWRKDAPWGFTTRTNARPTINTTNWNPVPSGRFWFACLDHRPLRSDRFIFPE
jgi:hypothetical protein